MAKAKGMAKGTAKGTAVPEKAVEFLEFLVLAFLGRPPTRGSIQGAPVLGWNRGLYCLRGHFWDLGARLLRAARAGRYQSLVPVSGKGGLPRLKREAGLVPQQLRGYHKELVRALEALTTAKDGKAQSRALLRACKALQGAFTTALGVERFGPELAAPAPVPAKAKGKTKEVAKVATS